MKDFIAVLKFCRLKEIKEYKDKQYTISNNFKCYRKFHVKYINEEYHFGVSCEFFEMKFYIIDSDIFGGGETPVYYSLIELMNLLFKSNKDLIMKILHSKRNIKTTIYFEGAEYKFNFFKLDKYIKNIDEKTLKLLLLLCLIQEKSNVFFGTNTEYHEGIIRLFIVLQSVVSDKKILVEKGWHFKEAKFILRIPKYINSIIICFSSTEKKDCMNFKEKLTKAKDKDEIKRLFYEKYKEKNNINYEFKEYFDRGYFKKELEVLKVEKYKLYKSLVKLNDMENSNSNFYTEEEVYIGSNIFLLLRISSPSKYKYYLTKEEFKDIMKG